MLDKRRKYYYLIRLWYYNKLVIENHLNYTRKKLIYLNFEVNDMIYRLPELNDKSILQEYMQEHYDNKEYSISASHGLPVSEYADWVEKIQRSASVGEDGWGKYWLYLCFENDKLVGLLSIRYELSESLTEEIGNIGYGVRPFERNKGYATTMLCYALSVCKDKGKDKVLLGCYKDNLPSVAVIKKCGGVLVAENDNYNEGRISQYYLINKNLARC